MPDLLRLQTHQVARFLNSHRVFFYTLVSLLSVSAVIVNALKNYSNFYSVAIFLSKSSRSVLVLANFGFLLAILTGHIVQRIFFGSLRPNEVERLYDRLWFFITESLLAFTIFRDDFDTPFALMFGFLLFVKSFHWLASDRIEWMDQRPYPGPPLLFHFRMTVLFTILWFTDCLMFLFAVDHTLTAGVGGMVLFASEYGILMASVMNTILKYLLSTYDLRRAGRRGGENAPPWENKSMWIFYIELGTDFLKLTTYLVFFVIIITFYGLPLNIVRDVYITARSFITRLRALHRYQTATRNMDQRYPNATEEELTAMSDRTCIICREEMTTGAQDPPAHPDGPNTTPKKLPCSHIFHFYCLRSWLERQQSCPTCRRNVLENPIGAQPPTAGLQGQPPAPVPGQLPANQNPPMNAQNGPPGNNPLGFLGRYLGLPARPPNAPPTRQVVQPDNHQGQPGGQGPGIFINYQVQYQFPRANNDGNQPAPQPQRIPQYPGFPGPGGVWQPWPAEAPVEPNPTEAETANTTQTGVPLETVQETSSSSTESTSSEPDDLVNPPQDEDGVQSPREAALSRLGGKSSFTTKPTNTPSVPDIGQTPRTSSLKGDESNLPKNPTNNVQPPKLIPLLDFRSHVSVPRPTAPPQQTSNPFIPPFSQQIRPAPRPAMYPSSSSSLSSSQLPPTLTDQQLQTLDRLTRESIDERLRILEGVSGAAYRCIDDLMRLRSALPPLNISPTPASPIPQQPSSNPGPSVEGENGATSTGRGKEKMREVEVEEESETDISDNNQSSNHTL
ncbi:hypothetical protein GALMADRAFT_227041 [Galerina marginata CBS 339.88]|uniref:RING-type E3 ubiquitin transferase n=1 Tax=Galerina marginata (strain CBS 339.88) TaxID=685588 RepID=A0A067SWX3_GALM3|nr:hypothetical protein GALMADRAFT_227041 [Galerina marginata CBS 339.88]